MNVVNIFQNNELKKCSNSIAYFTHFFCKPLHDKIHNLNTHLLLF